MSDKTVTPTSQAKTYTKTKGDNPFLHIIKSTGYSLEGLLASLKHEMAFRIECVLALILIPMALLLPIPWIFRGVLISSILLVLVVELLNSALEWVVDYISLERHPFAKRAKDMGSAAVFIALLNCTIWWGLSIALWNNWIGIL